jgi:hypothetical protein
VNAAGFDCLLGSVDSLDRSVLCLPGGAVSLTHRIYIQLRSTGGGLRGEETLLDRLQQLLERSSGEGVERDGEPISGKRSRCGIAGASRFARSALDQSFSKDAQGAGIQSG